MTIEIELFQTDETHLPLDIIHTIQDLHEEYQYNSMLVANGITQELKCYDDATR